MTLSDVAIRRPIFTVMMSATLVVVGVVGFLRLGTDLYPDVSMPFCTISTVYAGAGPEEVESQVTRPIEDAVSGISGIKRVISSSHENVSFVFVEFRMQVPMAEAMQLVRDKIGVAIAQLPQGVEPPVVSRFDLAAQPVVVFSVSSGGDSTWLRERLDDQVRPLLEQLDGVATARVIGGGKREVTVDLFPERLQALMLTPDAIFQRIRAEHLDLPGGRFPAGPTEVGIRVRGEFADVDGLRQMVVHTGEDGSVVRLADVALVREGLAEARNLVRTNLREAVAVEVIKQPGANAVQVADAVKARLADIQSILGPTARTDVIIDQSLQIRANAHEVWIAIFFGGAMAVLIIFLFLLDWRGTLISALALPTSVVGTLFCMWLLGYSLNQVTLLGLSLAIGLLIDDAVVVRESITRRLEAGEPPMRAASEGTREIALAVIATTLTLCAVFVPVAFTQGIVGRFLREFGLTVTCAVLLSLFVAFTLDPMLSSRFVRARRPGEGNTGHAGGQRGNLAVRVLRAALDATDRLYGDSLDLVLRHRIATVLVAALLFAGVLYLGSQLGAGFLEPEDRGQLLVTLELPPGSGLATTASRSAQAEAEVLKIPGVTAVYAVVGTREEVNKSIWRVNLVDKNQRREKLEHFKQHLRAILSQVPQAKVTVSDVPVLEGLGDYPPIWMEVIGRDFGQLRREAEVVAAALRAIPGTTDIQILDNPGKPELQIRVDRDQAARLGVPAGAVAMQVRLATNGEVAGKLRRGRIEEEIRVRLAGEARDSALDLERLWIWGPRGPVALSQLTSAVRADGPAVISHEQRQRQIGIRANITANVSLGEVVDALRARLGAHKLPGGYSYIWGGMQEDFADMSKNLGLALALALIFIFIVLASQFESLVHPFTIMLALPLALVGAVLAVALTGRSLSMGVYIGIILLMGLVTKNSILLVDGALQRIQAGDDPLTAVRLAGPRRLRPILMTSAAMVLGMLPTALGHGVGSEFRAPMAIAVIGGVITSTLLTLWVVPVVFLWVERLRASLRRRERPTVG